MKQVEQIHNGLVVLDYDTKLSPTQIAGELNKHFKVTDRKNSIFTVCIQNQNFTFLVKNITYLGHPHPIYTKRIQLSNGWEQLLKDQNTILLGLYTYKNAILYVHFDKKNYANRILNNSSAHVWTNDLLKGYEEGIFQKKDKHQNEITVIREDHIQVFITNKYVSKKTYVDPKINVFRRFLNTLPKKWFGMDCYAEMIKVDYHNKFQSEWAGFYFEYLFEKFLDDNPECQSVCRYIKDKTKGHIDLDIKFNHGFYGDLKTHSMHTSGILGNDLTTIQDCIENHGKIWYVILNHETIKDQDKNYVVTEFWNQQLNKENLRSYGSKMKHAVALQSLQILEINHYNKNYLSIFHQGKNSDGKQRNPKIKINKRVLNNFLIFEQRI